jgi:YrbI family 3-deoxy-D-manno-octulosonate 8-phosphate phosphatase
MIRLFISDVDGVLTDGSMYYSENGDELKRFSTYDGMAFMLLNELNVKTAIITSENTKIVSNRSKKMKIDYLYQGLKNLGKLESAREICETNNISFDSVCYIGDDINCYELLSEVKYAACPSNAVDKIKKIPNIKILKTKGGSGAVREYVEYLISKKLI